MDSLTPEQRNECCMVFHTAAVDEAGTDLRAVCKAIIPDDNVILPDTKFTDKELNYLYNSSDVYINLASNEGFGLGSAEALMTGTPIIVNVTGGLQDQCGFKKEDGTYLTAEDYVELKSNHRGTYKEHGEWVKPVFPSNISLQGSPLTPYIYDDRCSHADAGEALYEWYDMGEEERERCGQLGYEFVKDKNIGMDSVEMCNRFESTFEGVFTNWKPKSKYVLEVI